MASGTLSSVSPTAIVEYVDAKSYVSYTNAQAEVSYQFLVAELHYTDAQAVYVALVTSLKLVKPFETLALNDTISIAIEYIREALDSISFIDNAVLAIGKNISDGFAMDDMSMVDGFVVEYNMIKANIVTMGEVIAKSVARPASDGITITDLLDILLAREVLDIFTVSDTVLIDVFYIPTAVLDGGDLNTFELNE